MSSFDRTPRTVQCHGTVSDPPSIRVSSAQVLFSLSCYCPRLRSDSRLPAAHLHCQCSPVSFALCSAAVSHLYHQLESLLHFILSGILGLLVVWQSIRSVTCAAIKKNFWGAPPYTFSPARECSSWRAFPGCRVPQLDQMNLIILI